MGGISGRDAPLARGTPVAVDIFGGRVMNIMNEGVEFMQLTK